MRQVFLKCGSARAKKVRELIKHAEKEVFSDILHEKDISDHSALEYLLRGSPKLRAMLPVICDQILLYNEKSVIWCVNPAQHLFIGAALHLCSIDAHVFHSELDHYGLEMLVQAF